MAIQQLTRGASSLSPITIVIATALSLGLGHLAIKTFFPSTAINTLGIILVTSIFFSVLILKRDVFAFILMIFFTSMFQYANNQGGLFNLAAFLPAVLYLFKVNIRETTRTIDIPVILLLIILLASDLLGLLFRNPASGYLNILQAISFLSFILIFYISSNLYISEKRLKNLLVIIAVMVTYNFVVSINQQTQLIQIETPLLGLNEELFYRTTNAFGAFGSASASAQFAMMMLAFLIPLSCATVSRNALNIKLTGFVLIALMCISSTILANLRAAAIESIILIIFYSIIFMLFYRRSFRYSRYLNIFSITLVFLLVSHGSMIGLENIREDLQGISITTSGDVLTGSAINRGSAWRYALNVLEQGSWWLGYGQGVFRSNLVAWGGSMSLDGTVHGGGHFHNLYLALPTLFGWFGSIAYVSLYLLTVLRLMKAVKRYGFDHLMVVASLGFLMSVVFFLLDELKSGNAVQTINYPMIIWIWLGLANAAVKTLRVELMAAATKDDPDKIKPRRVKIFERAV